MLEACVVQVGLTQVLVRHEVLGKMTDDRNVPKEVLANILAGRLLIIAAQKASASLDSFSGWLVAGLGAALALFIANLDTVSKFVSTHSITCAAVLFTISALLAVLAKLLATFVAAGTAAVSEGAALGKDTAARNIELDVNTLFAETKKALFWPGTFFAQRAFDEAQSGDFSGSGRMYSKAAQLQGVVVVLQAGLSLAAVVVIVAGLAV